MTALLLILLGAALGYAVGFVCGRSSGHDAGWCQCHFDQIAKERERRDRLGRFRKVYR